MLSFLSDYTIRIFKSKRNKIIGTVNHDFQAKLFA